MSTAGVANVFYSMANDGYDVCKIKNQKFALFSKPLRGSNITIELLDCHIVILSPWESQTHISITGKSILLLNKLQAEGLGVTITTKGKYVTVNSEIDSIGPAIIRTQGIFHVILPVQEKNSLERDLKEGINTADGDRIEVALMDICKAIAKETPDKKGIVSQVNSASEFLSD